MLPLFLIVQIFLLFVRICIISPQQHHEYNIFIVHHSQTFYFRMQTIRQVVTYVIAGPTEDQGLFPGKSQRK